MVKFFREKGAAFGMSILLHVLVLVLPFVLDLFPKSKIPPAPATAPPLKAKLASNKEVERYMREIKKEEREQREKERKKKELEERAKRQRREQKKTAKKIQKDKEDYIKRQRERKRVLAEKKKKAEEERKKRLQRQKRLEIAARKKKKELEQKRKKAEKARKEREKKRKAEEKRKRIARAKAEKKRKAAAKKRRERKAREKALEKKLAELRRKELLEDKKKQEGELSRERLYMQRRWIAAISAKIKRNWTRPSTSQNDEVHCKVYVRITRSGTVLEAKTRSCTGGTELLKRSVESAVIKSDPLPKPDSNDIFREELILNFRDLPK